MASGTRSRKDHRTGTSMPRHDAVSLLEENHRTLRRLLSRFARSRDHARRAELARRFCSAAAIHARLEAEILAPAFLASGGDAAAHHQAEVTRNTCAMLIASFGGADLPDQLHARMQILAEVIRRHMCEEERPGGFFAAARATGMDLQALGQSMRLRRYLLQNGAGPGARGRPSHLHRPAAHRPRAGQATAVIGS